MAALARQGALALGAVMAVAVLLVTGLHAILEEDIRANQHAYETAQLRSLQQALAPNAALGDAMQLQQELPASVLHAVYPLYEEKKLVAVIARATALEGYNGAIELLIGFRTEADFAPQPPKLRVLHHQETPGLADFLNKNPEAAYDGVSSASVSAKAVVRTVEEIMDIRSHLMEEF